VVIADLSLVDEVMQSFGLLTEVNLRFKDELEGEAVAARLRELLPKDVLIVDPDKQFQRISQTSEALRMNLTFLAALSLLVALLLGFQVMSLLTVRRKGDYATLISLGTSPSHLGKLIVFESMCIGVVGGVVGGLLGHLLGDYTVRAVQTTIDHFYTPVWERGVQFDIHVLLCVALLGGCIGLLGALLPAWSVFARPPREYFSRESESSSLRPRVGYLFFFGILLIGLGMLSASPQFLTSNPFAPFLSPLFLSVGMLLLSPALLFAFACVGRGVSQYMDSASLIALESVTARLRDMSIAVGALGVAFGMLIGISTMISSFRVTFQEWLDHILKADLFVSHYELTGISNREREKFLNYSAANPAVIGVHTATQYPYTFKNSKVFLRSTNLELSRDFDTLVFLSPKEPHWDSVLQGAGVFVSESFSRKFDISVGESLLLHLSGESLDFKVEGVFQDFSSDLGSILIHDSVLSRFALPGGHDLGISLFLKPSADVEQVQRELLQEFPGRLKMRDRRALKLEALRIFDNTFTITYVLQGLTLFISALFLVLALLLSVFDRRKEQLTLRTIGASFGFLQQVVVREALILSASATFLGVLLGAALSWVLVYRINVIFFGWTVKLLPPYLVMIADIGGFFVVSVALAVLISRVSLREIPLEVLRYE
ncbi:MAG: FtsX-like permease family protein, partial [Bdellovibrionales bacterium]|nr:FtsX-like permease family protein [Bdellovibrionales bacterium]